MRRLVLLFAAAAALASALPHNNGKLESPSADAIVDELVEERVSAAEAYMKPGMAMGSMHEPIGAVGLFECKLRAMDRVLRQHPHKYQPVRKAILAFETSMTKLDEDKLPNVKRYLGCVIGMGELLPDCTMMGPVHTSAIETYLKQGGSAGLQRIEELSIKQEGFAQDWKGVQGVVCDKPVFNAINNIHDVDQHSNDKNSMKHMSMQGMHHGMSMHDMQQKKAPSHQAHLMATAAMSHAPKSTSPPQTHVEEHEVIKHGDADEEKPLDDDEHQHAAPAVDDSDREESSKQSAPAKAKTEAKTEAKTKASKVDADKYMAGMNAAFAKYGPQENPVDNSPA